MTSFLVILQFLTRIPSPINREDHMEEMGARCISSRLRACSLACCSQRSTERRAFVFPLPVVDAGVVVLMIAFTGALHLDGLMDTCDGIFSFKSPEQRLTIMRDSRVGAFGVIGAVALLLLKFGALARFRSSCAPESPHTHAHRLPRARRCW